MIKAKGLIPANRAEIIFSYEKEGDKLLHLNRIKVHYQLRENDFKDTYQSYDKYRLKWEIGRRWDGWLGAGCSDWNKADTEGKILYLMHFIFSERIEKEFLKEVLFEFGKIKEMEGIRRMWVRLYHNSDMSYEGLMSSFYNHDFCAEW